MTDAWLHGPPLSEPMYRGVIVGYARALELVDVDVRRSRESGNDVRAAVLEDVAERLRAEILEMGERAPVDSWGRR